MGLLQKLIYASLVVLAVAGCGPVGHLQSAEEMPPLENYQPPPHLFDEEPTASQEMATTNAAPFLTFVAPAEEKTKEPVRRLNKPANQKNKKKSSAKVKKQLASAVSTPSLKSRTQLEMGQRLVTPTAHDVLASIAGEPSVKKAGGNKISLEFVPAETVLTLEMKNILLRDYIPRLKKGPDSSVEIRAYATVASVGENAVPRVACARAQEISDFLVAAGIEPSRIKVISTNGVLESVNADRADLQSIGSLR